MHVLAHISDMHFGTVIPEIAAGLKEKIADINPELVIVSGDLTQRAKSSQFKAAREFLNQIPFPQLIVPGNHDIPLFNVPARFLLPLRKYKKYISRDLYPFYQDNKIAVQGINTARSIAWANGRISQNLIKKEVYQKFINISDSLVKILVTHHPFLVPPQLSGKAAVGRAADTLRLLESCKLDIILSGHFHMSYSDKSHTAFTTPDRSILVVQAGTAISRRTPIYEDNSFNIICIDKNQIYIIVYIWKKEEFIKKNIKKYELKQSGWELVF